MQVTKHKSRVRGIDGILGHLERAGAAERVSFSDLRGIGSLPVLSSRTSFASGYGDHMADSPLVAPKQSGVERFFRDSHFLSVFVRLCLYVVLYQVASFTLRPLA